MGSKTSLRTIFTPRLPWHLGIASNQKRAFSLGNSNLCNEHIYRKSHESLALWAGIVSPCLTAKRASLAEKLTLSYRIGGFYAFILGRSKDVELTVVARSNYETVKSEVRAPTLTWRVFTDHKTT
jgi:hypothetical protein